MKLDHGRLLVGAAVFLAAMLAAPTGAAQEPVPVPRLTSHVVDLTGTLAAPEREALDAKLRGFEDGRGSRVAGLLAPTSGPETRGAVAGRATGEWQTRRTA